MQKYFKDEQEKMKNNSAVINKIIPFSNVDGPGNRCAIFFQGCNVHCIYCHNTETINPCNNCQDCLKSCFYNALSIHNSKIVYDEKQCQHCGACIRTCKYNASPKTKIYSVDKLVEEIKSYTPFIRGVTVSGGEPTLNRDFVISFFKKVKEMDLSCFVDTNGFFDLIDMKDLIKVTDKFLMDIKSVGNLKTLCGTDRTNHIVNLKYLLSLDKVHEVRTVILKDVMDARQTVKEVANVLKNYPDVKYKLIKVHTTGLTVQQKKKLEGKIPSDEEMLSLSKLAIKIGVSLK